MSDTRKLITRLKSNDLHFNDHNSEFKSFGVVVEYFDNIILLNQDFGKKQIFVLETLSLTYSLLMQLKRFKKKNEENLSFSLRLETYFQPTFTGQYCFKAIFYNGGLYILEI